MPCRATPSPAGKGSHMDSWAEPRTTRRRSSPRSALTRSSTAPYQENARRWYREAQERVLFLNHAIVHPPVDRTRPADEIADICVHVEKETDAGLVVSGAKVVATGSALTHHNFVAHYGLPLKKKEFGVVFMAADERQGPQAHLPPVVRDASRCQVGSPFDYPLSPPVRRERLDPGLRQVPHARGRTCSSTTPSAPTPVRHLGSGFARAMFHGLRALGGEARLPLGPLHQGRRDGRLSRSSGTSRCISARC